MVKIVVQGNDFDLSRELTELRAELPEVGAIVSFVGTVRAKISAPQLKQMELEHYPGMTEKSLEIIVQQACQRWEVSNVVVIHRIGLLSVGEQIVLVAVASKHRGTAFEACEFIMDYLKTEAPFWKKEIDENGTQWVDARDSDFSALQKWESN